MKTFPYILALSCLLLPSASMAQERKAAIRDSVSPEQLSRAFEKMRDPLNGVEPMPELKETPQPRAWDAGNIVERSEFLSFQGIATMVPKGSVLHIPEFMKSRVGITDDARIVTWAEFIRANRGWITTHEVTRDQAEGRQEFSEAALNSISRSTNVVIATLSGGPITVLPPQDDGGAFAGIATEP